MSNQVNLDANAPVALLVQDVVVLTRALDLAAQRGAFRAAEMADVGIVYSKAMKAIAELAQKVEAEDK